MFRKEVSRQLIFIFFLIVLVSLEGVIGFMAIEGWGLLDALFMTIITISTVGYHEVHTLSSGGKIFTAVLIITGMGVFLYAIGRLTSFLVEADIRQVFRRRKMEKKLKALNGHVIVCGFGRNGQEAISVLLDSNSPCAVIDQNVEIIAKEAPEGLLYMVGDAKEEETLLGCSIREAKALIAALPSDADNLYVTLNARRLNPRLMIVARASEDESLKNLRMAGADHIVSPDRIGGRRMAMEILNPALVGYVDTVHSKRPDVPYLGQVELMEDSPFVGKTIAEAKTAMHEDCYLVALQREGEMMFPASRPQTIIQQKDNLIVFGLPRRIEELEEQVGVS